MLGCVMKLDRVQQAAGLGGRKRLIQAGPVVGIQVVLHQPDLLGLGVIPVHQLLHAPRIVLAGAPLTDPDMTPAAQRLAQQQLVADALALVLVVHLRRVARPRPPRRPHLAEELLARLIEADHRVLRVVRQQVGLDHVLQAPDVLGVGLRRDAPRRDDPRLDVVFFSACRTVSVLTASTSPKTTSSSASSCKVHWQRPSGGSLHARWISRCSMSPLILILSGRCGCGLGSRAAGRPAVTTRRRTRPTVQMPTPRAATIWSSVRPPPVAVSANRRMRAWVSRRAAPLPTETKCSKSARSSVVNVTRYLSIAASVTQGEGSAFPSSYGSRATYQSKIDGILVWRRSRQSL